MKRSNNKICIVRDAYDRSLVLWRDLKTVKGYLSRILRNKAMRGAHKIEIFNSDESIYLYKNKPDEIVYINTI